MRRETCQVTLKDDPPGPGIPNSINKRTGSSAEEEHPPWGQTQSTPNAATRTEEASWQRDTAEKQYRDALSAAGRMNLGTGWPWVQNLALPLSREQGI